MASDSCCIVNDNFQQKTQRFWRCRGFPWLSGVRIGHAKTICICIPPSKLQWDTTQRQTLIGRHTRVSWNLMETPVLVLGRGCTDLIRIAP